MDLISKAEAMVRGVRRKSLSKLAVYRRGSSSIPAIVVTHAETRAQSDDGELIVNTKVVDWIIEAEDLVLNGSATEPQAGDRIEWNDRTFELAAIGGEKCWRWHGRDGLSFRVHTKVVA